MKTNWKQRKTTLYLQIHLLIGDEKKYYEKKFHSNDQE